MSDCLQDLYVMRILKFLRDGFFVELGSFDAIRFRQGRGPAPSRTPLATEGTLVTKPRWLRRRQVPRRRQTVTPRTIDSWTTPHPSPSARSLSLSPYVSRMLACVRERALMYVRTYVCMNIFIIYAISSSMIQLCDKTSSGFVVRSLRRVVRLLSRSANSSRT